MKTKLTALLLLAVSCAAGQAVVQPTAQPVTDSPPSLTAVPPAPKTTGLAVVVPVAVELPPLVVISRPAKPARPPAALPKHQRAPWEIASWDLGPTRLVLDATLWGRLSDNPHTLEPGLARVDLIQLHW